MWTNKTWSLYHHSVDETQSHFVHFKPAVHGFDSLIPCLKSQYFKLSIVKIYNRKDNQQIWQHLSWLKTRLSWKSIKVKNKCLFVSALCKQTKIEYEWSGNDLKHPGASLRSVLQETRSLFAWRLLQPTLIVHLSQALGAPDLSAGGLVGGPDAVQSHLCSPTTGSGPDYRHVLHL